MLETMEPRTVEESYQVAGNTSDLSVDADRRQSADVIIAAGMSESRLGMALLRLVSEWDAAAKPRKLTEAQIVVLSLTLKAGNEAERANRDRENAERVARGEEPLAGLPLLKDPLGRARVEATMWYARELRLLAQSLKTRGVVLAQIHAWAIGKGIDADCVGPAIYHWLHATCPVCDGHGVRKLPDAPALSAKRCHACQGAGKALRPEGSTRIQNHLDHCVSVARASLKRRLSDKR